LADPFVLGVSSGASLGVALVVLGVGTTGSLLLAGLGLTGDFGLTVAAFVGAAITLFLVVSVASRVQSLMTLLILGLMFGYATSTIVNLELYFSLTERIKAYMSWTFGSLSGETWGQLPTFIPVILAGIMSALMLSKPLNALLLGEGYARSMGMNVRRGRLAIITSTALLAGTVTAFCGPIGFLGLAVPHIARMLFKTNLHLPLTAACFLLGGVVCGLCNALALSNVFGLMIPVNILTAMLGSPFVVWLIYKQNSAT
jgi:iron complex transport system permease protein